MRRSMLLVAPVLLVAALPLAPADASPGQTCATWDGSNAMSPSFYQMQYNDGLEKSLKKHLTAYDIAVQSGDAKQIGDTAGSLHSEVFGAAFMVDNPTLFGCYNATALSEVHTTADAFESTLNKLNSAGPSDDISGLLASAKRQERSFVEAINVYAGQFGAAQV